MPRLVIAPPTHPFVIAVLVVTASVVVTGRQPELPAFEVASVKPQVGDAAFVPSSPDRFVDVNATLRSLITWAYDVRDFQIEGGSEWTSASRFDVSARAPRAVSQPTMRLMLRRLLAERFQLRLRTESRQLARYVLVRARDGRLGERLQPAMVNCAAILAERMGVPPAAAPGSSAPGCAWRVGIAPPVARMFVDGAPMAEFAGLLERLVGRKVIDQTGLAGTFNIRLEFDADQLPMPLPPSADAPAPARDGLSLFTALEEQLGLKLQSERGPVEVLVTEAAEPPAPD